MFFRSPAVLCLFFAVSFTSNASELLEHQDVHSSYSCFSGPFESYDAWRTLIETKKRNQGKGEAYIQQQLIEFEKLFPKDTFEGYRAQLDCEYFQYQVDGIDVFGYVIKPKGQTNLPIVINNRGGNGNFGAVVMANMMETYFPLAEKGYAIIGSQYRGTFQANPIYKEEFGGVDVNDVLKIVQLSDFISGVDATKKAILGTSRGGMQTYLTLKHNKEIKVAAIIAGMSNLIQGLTERPEMENVYRNLIPNYESNKTQALKERSITFWLDDIGKNVPILLLHGEDDKRVSVNQSITLASMLEAREHPHQLIVFPDDDHYLSTSNKDAIDAIDKWFQSHL